MTAKGRASSACGKPITTTLRACPIRCRSPPPRDLAVLARHLAYDFPQYFPYFALPGFNYKGVYYPTHDNLIGRYDGADGIKTGYTGATGFNLRQFGDARRHPSDRQW